MDRGSSMDDREPSPKRRRVRKGTQSCWECKRRKIRCTTFAANGASLSTGVVCDGCRSRKTRCIGQEYDQDNTDLPAATDQAHRGILHASTPVPTVQNQISNNLKDISCLLAACWPGERYIQGILDVSTRVSVLFHGVLCLPYPQLFELLDDIGFSPKQTLQLPPNATSTHPVLIARRLLLLANFLQDLPVESISRDGQTGEELMQRLTTTASRLVTSNDELAGSSLEGIECVMLESMHLINAGQFRRAWMANRRAMLMAQLLGLHFHRHAAVRGTGKDKKPMRRTGAPPTLEANTSVRSNPAIMWYRLNANDIFLSLLLGFPPEAPIISSPMHVDERPSYATREELRDCSPLERLERAITLVGGYILQRQTRRQRRLSSPEALVELVACDDILLEGASHMPPHWWALVPGDGPAGPLSRDDKSTASPARQEVEHTLRMMAQFAYHHVSIQLHLPYMLLDSSQDTDLQAVIDRSRATAAHASRTIANQYIAFFRSQGHSKPAYCRGVDFVAFVACVTLSLAHMQMRQLSAPAIRYQENGILTGPMYKSHNPLRHQQLTDRGLLDRIIGVLEDMAAMPKGDDIAADKMAKLLRQLLAVHDHVEEKHEQGWSVGFRLETEEENEDNLTAAADVAQAPAVCIRIPHMNTIVIESLPPNSARSFPGRQTIEHAWGSIGISPPMMPNSSDFMANDEWTLQGVDMALFTNLAQGMFGEIDAGESLR